MLFRSMSKMRTSGINAEIYPDSTKMKKQMTYADKKGIPFVVIAGEDERTNEKLTVKNMATGEQQSLTIDEAIELISK